MKQSDPADIAKGLPALFFIIAVAVFMVSTCGEKESKPARETSAPTGVVSGDIVTLPYMPLGTTSENYNRLVQLANAKDAAGWENMLSNGQAFLVAEGTKARVIGTKVLQLEVRVMDGKYEGQSGWISRELVKKVR